MAAGKAPISKVCSTNTSGHYLLANAVRWITQIKLLVVAVQSDLMTADV